MERKSKIIHVGEQKAISDVFRARKKRRVDPTEEQHKEDVGKTGKMGLFEVME